MGNIQAKILSSTTNTSNNNYKGNSEEILRAEVIGIVNDDNDGGVSTSVGGEEEVEGLTIVAIAKDKGRGKLERKRLVVLCCCMLCYPSMAFAVLYCNAESYSIRYSISSLLILFYSTLYSYKPTFESFIRHIHTIQFNDTQFGK